MEVVSSDKTILFCSLLDDKTFFPDLEGGFHF